MAVFVVIPQPNPNAPRLGAAVTQSYPENYFTLDDGKGWLVFAVSTAQELSEKLGVTDGTNGAAIILEMASYFGRANPNVWSWIKAKLEAPRHG